MTFQQERQHVLANSNAGTRLCRHDWAIVLGSLWQWIEEHLLGCGGNGGSGVSCIFIWCVEVRLSVAAFFGVGVNDGGCCSC